MELELVLAPVNDSLLALGEAELCARWGLSPAEAARGAAFVLPRDRAEHASARAVVRAELARRLRVEPAALAFERGGHGRPRLAAPFHDADVDFNVAHSDGLVVCLLGPAGTLFGVDVERATRPRDLQVASDFFAPSEVEELLALAPAQRLRRFYELWTSKEAYIKARGLGLAIPLDSFRFSFTRERPQLTIESGAPRLEDGSVDRGDAWSFQHLDEGEHLIAVGVRADPGSLVIRRFTWPCDRAP